MFTASPRNLALLLTLSASLGCGAAGTAGTSDVTRTVVEDLGAPPTGQLPAGITPLHYTLALSIDPTTERLSGTVAVRLKLDAPQKGVWMHGLDMNVPRAEVVVGAERVAARWHASSWPGVARVAFDRVVPAGEVTLELDYDVAFSKGLEGLYRVESRGAWYAFTQFEAISARKAFPCFDEPRFKTPFDTTLLVRKEHVGATNGPLAREEALADGTKRLTFRTTEPLPTYLVAFAVGELDVVAAPDLAPNAVRKAPLPFRGIAVKGQGKNLAYALANTGKILEALERYTGIAYPYAKLDVVAVPDFGSGAMENVGLITFREQLLLLDPATSTEMQRRSFAYVMAHELAHQWFGNLVTMPWWDDIWLNEAFASWMDNRITQELYPEYRVEADSVLDTQRAMGADSLAAARQIRQPITSEHDIENAFDAITYAKGAGVIEMIERWVTPEVFQKGIHQYLEAHRFGSATFEDMLRAQDAVAGKDVGTAWKTFLLQPGVPLLRTKVVCDAAAGASLEVTQSRYLPVGSKGEKGLRWQVPMCARYESGGKVEQACGLVAKDGDRVALPGRGCPAWVMPNADGAGYFRVALDSADLGRLRTKAWPKLSVREKLALADSLRAAFLSGDITVKDLVETLPLLAKDRERGVMTAGMVILGMFWQDLVGDAERAEVESLARRLYAPRMAALGLTPKAGEDGETAILRAQVLGFMVRVANDPKTKAAAAKLGLAYAGGDAVNPKAVDPNLVGFVMDAALEAGDAALFGKVVGHALASDDAMVRQALLGAAASVKDAKLAAHARALVFDERVRKNEVRVILGPQLTTRETRDAAWTWFQQNWDRYVERVTAEAAGGAPNYVMPFCGVRAAEDVERFFGSKVEKLLGGPRNLALASERIRLCGALVDAQGAAVRAHFAPPARATRAAALPARVAKP